MGKRRPRHTHGFLRDRLDSRQFERHHETSEQKKARR
jgi:hypothetical protein